MSEFGPFSTQDSLAALMIAVSASDADLGTPELLKITTIVNNLPVFAGYDDTRLARLSAIVFQIFEDEEGLDALFGLIREAMPERLFETAYALACDVVAADGVIRETEARMLEEIRYEFNIDRLHAAAIERGARARHMPL